MYVIQLIEEFYRHEQAIEALQNAREMSGFLGGSVLLPLGSDYTYKLQAFFESGHLVTDARAEFPEGVKLIYVPERLLAWYGIEVPK